MEQMIVTHLPMVRMIAAKMAAQMPPTVDFDDLVSSGTLGLLDAARKFDPLAGAAFHTYANHRIRGAMLDYLRAWDWVPRGVRADVRNGLREPPPKVLSLDVTLNDDENRPLTLADLVPDLWADDPAEVVAAGDVARRVRAVIDLLTTREYTVIRRYYWDGWTMVAIGEEIGVTEGRISQIHQNALRHLRQFLQLEGFARFSEV